MFPTARRNTAISKDSGRRFRGSAQCRLCPTSVVAFRHTQTNSTTVVPSMSRFMFHPPCSASSAWINIEVCAVSMRRRDRLPDDRFSWQRQAASVRGTNSSRRDTSHGSHGDLEAIRQYVQNGRKIAVRNRATWRHLR